MANIKLTLPGEPFSGQIVTFTAPCDCASVTNGLVIGGDIYTICDAVGKCVTDGGGGRWMAGAQVSVVLDCENKKAFIQNAAVPDITAGNTTITQALAEAIGSDPNVESALNALCEKVSAGLNEVFYSVTLASDLNAFDVDMSGFDLSKYSRIVVEYSFPFKYYNGYGVFSINSANLSKRMGVTPNSAYSHDLGYVGFYETQSYVFSNHSRIMAYPIADSNQTQPSWSGYSTQIQSIANFSEIKKFCFFCCDQNGNLSTSTKFLVAGGRVKIWGVPK